MSKKKDNIAIVVCTLFGVLPNSCKGRMQITDKIQNLADKKIFGKE